MTSIGPNRFKQALAEKRSQIGFWSTLGTPIVADLLTDSGFDWLLLDCEHSSSDVQDILPQITAVDRSKVTTPVVRPPPGMTWLFSKSYWISECGHC